MKKKTQSYSTEAITVTFDPNRCVHSAICLRGLPEVFDIAKRRWVRPEKAAVEEVVKLVSRCPSHALGYSLTPTDDSRIE